MAKDSMSNKVKRGIIGLVGSPQMSRQSPSILSPGSIRGSRGTNSPGKGSRSDMNEIAELINPSSRRGGAKKKKKKNIAITTEIIECDDEYLQATG